MLRNRKGHLYKRIIRKLFAVFIFVIGIRLIWVSVVTGWTSNVTRDNRDIQLAAKHSVQFVEGDDKISHNFKFSRLKNEYPEEGMEPGFTKTKVNDVKSSSPKNLLKRVKEDPEKGNGGIAPDTEKQNLIQTPVVTKQNSRNNSISSVHSKNTSNKKITDKVDFQARSPVRKLPNENTAGNQNRSSAVKSGMHVINRTLIAIPSNIKKSHDVINVKESIRNAINKTSLNKVDATAHIERVKENKTEEADENGKKHLMELNFQDNAKLTGINSNLNIKVSKDDNVLKEAASRGICKLVEPWGQKYNADISTYDLFKNVSYKMDDNGNYPIPVKTVEELRKAKELKPLTVILVPFSHADPGYGLTIEQYYNQMTHATLDNMLVKLVQYPNMTFQWAETVFLARWFEDLDENGKETVKRLINNGQLEVVLGGWVMPDEASTNYVAVVDQLIEGHQWLLEHLGVKPKSAWVNDPFGYSSTMPYFWKSSGMDNLLFLRINQPVKAKLMKRKSLEFMWRPYWKTSNDSDVLSSLMSYTNYWVSDVCGPEQKSCQEFNFLHLWEGESRAVQVTETNVAEQAKKLSEQFRITSDLYKHNTLYIGLGEDFSYPKPHQWDNMYTNYEKLINFINSQTNWNMTIKFGTLTEYFTQVRKEERKMAETSNKNRNNALTFPTISGDFFPYTERNQEFWTGYFTTRPLNKRFSREIESLTRAADIFNVIVYSLFKYYGVEYRAHDEVARVLRTARRELGMFMHHDGITGTSLPHVVDDYEHRLFKANEDANMALKMAVLTLLSKGKQFNPKLLQEETVKPGTKQMSGSIIFETKKDVKILLINPIARRRKEVINIFVNSKEIQLASPSVRIVPYQISAAKENSENEPFILSFETDLPAFGIEEYTILPKHDAKERIEVYESAPTKSESVLEIENAFMKVEFEKDTGMIKRIIHKSGHVTNITAQFMVYQSKTSGAYIFGPAGHAQAFMTGAKTIKVKKGRLFSEVKVTSSGFLISVKLYNTSSIQGHGVHVKTEVDMAAVGMKEMEVILRFKTDVQNGDNFYTDQNGFQLIGRENRPGDKIESNYYPVTTMLILEDSLKRLTLHCKQPHGGASLKSGQFEIMLDRHTFRDDKRGLGQGVYDNVRVNSDFIIHIEHKSHSFRPEEVRYTYPSEDSTLMNDMLQNGIFKYNLLDTGLKLLTKVHPLKSAEFPCGVSVVGFRNLVKSNLEYNSTSLVLHRKPIHCGYVPLNEQCSDNNGSLTIKKIFPKLKVKISETSLSHLYTKQQLTLNSDITPDSQELRAFKIEI
ncbi:alpha-mannosidase 2-like [Mercenaria mercenaria]|uniref:alpha-mannosidase 2-like n=1 Tax=Mercenaria mercenaria TaxID=6596 RepID=UPI00234E9FD3|nr:alpha-mannosidase 2-like [Mercenaria mercenaria]XP_045199530.2 alpha-mannosidase 2-like [Mercenaria mercenaria]XP_053404690.1 alpha-mannosidase 2-like [Mercenaria mercenaria]